MGWQIAFRLRSCDSRHKLAKATTINWPRMLVLVELFDHFRSLYNDKVARVLVCRHNLTTGAPDIAGSET
jgi:hypothetical protein